MPDAGIADAAALDAAFAALAAREVAPSAAFRARVLADAAAQLPPARRVVPRPAGPLQPGHGPATRRLLHRLQLPAGLAAALMVGVWIGMAAPAPVLMLEEALFGPTPFAGLVEPGELFAE